MSHELEFTFRDVPAILVIALGVPSVAFLIQGWQRMRRSILALLVVVGLTVPVAAQTQYVTLAEISVTGTAGTVFSSADILAGSGHPAAVAASCSLSGANIRVTFDGTTPTTSLGEVVYVGGPYLIQPTQNLLAMQAIRDDSTNGALNCTLIRQ